MRENTIDVAEHTHAHPEDGPPPRSWLDKGIARLVALGIAGLLGLALFLGLGDEVVALVSDQQTEAQMDGADIIEDANVQACIDQRAGDVDQLLADGVITEVQHQGFRSRAIQLCVTGAQTAPR